MAEDTKKISFSKAEEDEFREALSSWRPYLSWLKETADDEKIYKCMHFEIENLCRPQFIDRARTRFNKARAYRELKELEKKAGKILSINYV